MNTILKENKKGNLVIISGPSGAGKDTIVNELLKINNNLWVSVSCTTREIRKGEKDGINYFFITEEEFKEKINQNDFLEYATYNGNYYGTPRSVINDKLNNGIDVILVIEIQGALKIKKAIPEGIFIFILPPTMKELRNRLVNRNTDSKESIIERFKNAYQEINQVTKYNYVVINDDLSEATDKVNAILISEKCRVDRIEDVYLNNEEEELHELLIDKAFENKEYNY